MLLLDLKNNATTVLTNTPPALPDVRFDADGGQLAFIRTDKKGSTLHYYRSGMDSAKVWLTGRSPEMKPGYSIAGDAPVFSPNGRLVYFKLARTPVVDLKKDTDVITDKVDVWNYKDAYLQSQQQFEKAYGANGLYQTTFRTNFVTAITVANDKLVQVEDESTKLVSAKGNRYVLVSNVTNEVLNEGYWSKDQRKKYWLVSLLDGHSIDMGMEKCEISPNERFVCWFNRGDKNWYTYEIATGTTRNISGGIKVPLTAGKAMELFGVNAPFGIAAWLADDKAMLIYDQFDLWQADPQGKRLPVNITNGYGSRNTVKFRVTDLADGIPLANEQVLLIGQNQNNMNTGFFKTKTGNPADPETGTIGPWNFYESGIYGLHPPVKAKDAEVYLVKRMSASSAPNVFLTRDFKTYSQLSDVQPQRGYNWMTSELHHYKMDNGQTGAGILYKPENFDPAQKYPVIFHYYQARSAEVYNFQYPDFATKQFNISWYVSHGYLVFVPDIINDKPGYIGQTVVNSVGSAAKYLSGFSFVDASKMGIQGHSFGGYETNLLVAKTHIFAAAQSSAGISDLVSLYGDIISGRSAIPFVEKGQPYIGVSLWERPDLYLENSPLFSLDKVTTPLLIYHSRTDGAVPFTQNLELFTALRRLQKPVWMLQYDDEGHVMTSADCALDFSIRQEQFFDHYLKGKPAPKWMTEGIPAIYKGIKSGLQLDNAGKQLH